jgi:hypothetical protein
MTYTPKFPKTPPARRQLQEELKKLKKGKKHKFNAKRVEKAGVWFDSKAESRHHDEMLIRERAGEIRIEKIHDRVHLTADVHLVADFRVWDFSLNQQVWEEYKGVPSKEWQIKKKLWRVHGPGLLRVYYKTGKVEKIWPKPMKTRGE